MTSLLRRLRVGARFAVAFGLILALTLTSGAVAFAASRAQAEALKTSEDVTELVDYARGQDFWDASITGWQSAYAWDTYRLGVQQAISDDSDNRAGFLSDKKQLLTALEAAPVDLMSDEEVALNQRIVTNWNTFFTIDDQAVSAYRSGNVTLGEKLIIVDDWKVYQDILSLTQDLKESVSQRAAEARENADTTANVAQVLILTFSGLAVALVILLLVALIRTVVVPLRSLTDQAESLASGRLSDAIATVRSQPVDADGPALPEFAVQSKDELAGLAGALNHLQNNALDLAVEQHRNDRAAAEMLVNLGRRNQRLLTRTLGYLSDLERSESDPKTLETLFRLDHLSTRVRRNAESMLVLAGAEQTRTRSSRAPVSSVVRGALAEIEDYSRVDLFELDEAVLRGGAAADVTHLIAELLENATAFSPKSTRVVVAGGFRLDGAYRLSITDFGVGMTDAEIARANRRVAQAAQQRPDSKLLGHHVVGLLAARWGVTATLTRGAVRGLIATVDLPATLVVVETGSSAARSAAHASAGSKPGIAVTASSEEGAARFTVQGAHDDLAPTAGVTAAAPAAVLVEKPSASYAAAVAPVAQGTPTRVRGAQLTELGRDLGRTADTGVGPTVASVAAESIADVVPTRVRGAQLPVTGDDQPATASTPRSAEAVRRGLSGLQSGVARARHDAAAETSIPSETESE